MRRIVSMMLFILFTIFLSIAHSQPRKVIIDCDPGVDDAMELILAMQYPGIEIVGITVTSGHINIGQRTRNALRIVELSGKDIPVFQGSERPLFVSTLADGSDLVHGDDGLGNTNQPEPTIAAQRKSAAQFLVDATRANPGQITVLALGRLTNLADAIRLDSRVTGFVKEVVIAAGALRVPGLVTPVAEPNVWMDPHAADMVFSAPWNVTMFGLDVTMKNVISDALLLRIRDQNSKFGPFIYSISRVTREFQMKTLHSEGIIDIGASPILYMLDPTIFKFRKGPVKVVTEGIAIGQTIMPAYDFQLQRDPSWKHRPLVTAAYEVDVERFLEHYEAVMVGAKR